MHSCIITYIVTDKNILYLYLYFTFVYLSSFWQYGFVNHALELLVLRNYGPDVWEDIK